MSKSRYENYLAKFCLEKPKEVKIEKKKIYVLKKKKDVQNKKALGEMHDSNQI